MTRKYISQPLEPLSLSRKEACTYLGCGLTTLNNLRRAGLIEVRGLGSRTRIDRASLIAFYNSLPTVRSNRGGTGGQRRIRRPGA